MTVHLKREKDSKDFSDDRLQDQFRSSVAKWPNLPSPAFLVTTVKVADLLTMP